jgi:hypothetical protein
MRGAVQGLPIDTRGYCIEVPRRAAALARDKHLCKLVKVVHPPGPLAQLGACLQAAGQPRCRQV